MNGHGLLNTSSPKLTVPQGSEQASGAAYRTASRLAKLSVTAPPVDSWTMRPVPSRSAATVSASLPTSSVGRAASSLMCTWMTAAPAASHSLAVTSNSARVTGRAGAAALSASAPVGATVIRVAAMIMDTTFSWPGLAGTAGRDGQVLPGESQRLGQVRHPVLPGRRAVGLHLDDHGTGIPGGREQAEQFAAGLPAAAGHQVLVGHRAGRRAGAVGQVHVGQAAAELGRHDQGVGARGGGVGEIQGDAGTSSAVGSQCGA